MSDDTPPRRKRGRPRLAHPRTRVINVRCTASQRAEIEKLAGQAGMSVADFLRDQAVNGKPPRSIRRPQVDLDKLQQVLDGLRELGPSTNDMAHAANSGTLVWGDAERAELAELCARTKQLRDLLMEALRVARV